MTGRRETDHIAKALSHPLRAEILEFLSGQSASPSTLSKALDGGLSQVSYHVTVLKNLGLIRLVETIPRRGAVEHIYAGEPLPASLPRRAVPRSIRGHASAQALKTVLDKSVAALKAGTFDAREESCLSCISTAFDEQGWKQAMAVLAKADKEIARLQAASARRLAKTGERGIPATIALAGFESAPSKG